MTSRFNSSNTILAGNKSFTGTIEHIGKDNNGITISINTDQNGTLLIQWYHKPSSGVFHTNTYNYIAGDQFYKKVVKKSDYFNIIFVNQGVVSQAYFTLLTQFCDEMINDEIEVTNELLNLSIVEQHKTNSNLAQINSNIAGIKTTTDNLTFTGINELITTGNSYIHGWCDHHNEWEKVQLNSAATGHQKLLVIDEDVIIEIQSTNTLLTSLLNEMRFLKTARSEGRCFWAYNEGSTAGNLLNLMNNNPNKIYYVYNIQVNLGYSATASNNSFIAVNTIYNPSLAGATALNYYNLKLSSTTYNNVNIVSTGGTFSGVRNLTKLNVRADSSHSILDYQEELIELGYLNCLTLYINSPGTTTTNATIRWFETDI